MRKSSKLLVAAAAATLVATGGSAFTATSTIDDASKHVGARTQTISGLTITNVQHTVDTTDKTTKVVFSVSQELVSTDTVKATITSGTGDGGTPELFASETSTCVASDPGAGTTLTCDFTGVTNVTQLDIVAS